MSGCEGSEPFALRVLGDSMGPEFMDGEIIIVEPGNTSVSGTYVIADHDGEFVFRQLHLDNDVWYLRPLNPDYPTLRVRHGDAIKGRIISKSSGKGRQTKSYL